MNQLKRDNLYLVICTTFRSDFHVGWKNKNKHSTLNSTFVALAKWHEPHTNCFNFVKKTLWQKCISFRWENLLVNPNKFSLIHFGGIHGFTPKTIKANLVSCLDQIFVQSEFPNKTGNIINFRPGFKYLQCITFF